MFSYKLTSFTIIFDNQGNNMATVYISKDSLTLNSVSFAHNAQVWSDEKYFTRSEGNGITADSPPEIKPHLYKILYYINM